VQDSPIVLIVDDEPIVRDVTQRMLQLAGYSTLTTADGVEALDLCTSSARPIDLLLTDIKMPRMNAADLAHCLAEHKPGMPIMFMTGNASDSEAREYFPPSRDWMGTQ
jgi:CheY-like chemotaxis protein